MNYFIPIAELANYLLFSILAGHIALQFVPETHKPKIEVAKPILLLSTLGIILFKFVPIVPTIAYFNHVVGFTSAFQSVILNFEVGRAWIFIAFMSVFLWMAIVLNSSKYAKSLLLLLMILGVGYASHAASISFWSGFLFHSFHFLLVTLWVGILIHAAWFSKDLSGWPQFLKWFTPLAFLLVVLSIFTGINLMLFVMEPKDYVKAWVLPYGQMLLLKHISIIPVLLFAFMNGVLSRKSFNHPEFNPKPWIRGETIILAIVFYFTGVLGTLSPPHDVEFTVNFEGASNWVQWLLGKNINTTVGIHLTPALQSGMMILIAIVFMMMILVSFKKVKPRLSVLFGVCFIVVLYLGFMFSLTI
ncbi:copper resistance D family protein [Neobacillus dielmonensis]|uniref:copper resistance D family protein n=1 Tax=Neobacillus dielmonensis TaxID=1347369 RepID=UPI0005AB3F19|nr:CopD family protein [Neobacillus dielmonensis]